MTQLPAGLLGRAIRIHAHGDAGHLAVESVRVPAPSHDGVLVRVEAAGVNFIDVYKRSGLYKVPLPATLGEEGAGVVIAVGEGVSGVAPGDRVAWTGVLGSYADYVEVPLAKAVAVPNGVSTSQAAAIMLQGMTAHYLAASTYPLKHGDRCLIHAGSGGVGLLLVQLAKARGAYVIATVGTPEKVALAHYTATREELLARSGALFEMVASGALVVHIGAEFPLIEAASAHRALEGRQTVGKVLLRT